MLMRSRELHWNYKDVFRAARFGFSAKKIWTMFLGILLGTALYSLFTYIGMALSGLPFSQIWAEFRFIPFPWMTELTIPGKIFVGIGVFLCFVSYFIFGTAVSKITIEQLKGDEFYEVKRAIAHGFKSGRSAVLAPITLAIIVGLILLGGVILGLIGKIPYFGELVLLILAIPVIFIVFFMVYLIIAFFFSLFMAPAVVGTTKSDTFDTLFEVFSTMNEENWRFIGYQILLYGVKIVGIGLFAFFTGRVMAIINGVLSASWLMGTKFVNIADAALSYLPSVAFPNDLTYQWVARFLEITKTDILLYPPSTPSLPWPQAVLGVIFGILLYLLIFTVIAYWGAMHWAGNTIIFTIVLKKKDEIDLLEQKEEQPVVSPTHPPEQEEKTEEVKAEESSEGEQEEKKEEAEN